MRESDLIPRVQLQNKISKLKKIRCEQSGRINKLEVNISELKSLLEQKKLMKIYD